MAHQDSNVTKDPNSSSGLPDDISTQEKNSRSKIPVFIKCLRTETDSQGNEESSSTKEREFFQYDSQMSAKTAKYDLKSHVAIAGRQHFGRPFSVQTIRFSDLSLDSRASLSAREPKTRALPTFKETKLDKPSLPSLQEEPPVPSVTPIQELKIRSIPSRIPISQTSLRRPATSNAALQKTSFLQEIITFRPRTARVSPRTGNVKATFVSNIPRLERTRLSPKRSSPRLTTTKSSKHPVTAKSKGSSKVKAVQRRPVTVLPPVTQLPHTSSQPSAAQRLTSSVKTSSLSAVRTGKLSDSEQVVTPTHPADYAGFCSALVKPTFQDYSFLESSTSFDENSSVTESSTNLQFTESLRTPIHHPSYVKTLFKDKNSSSYGPSPTSLASTPKLDENTCITESPINLQSMESLSDRISYAIHFHSGSTTSERHDKLPVQTEEDSGPGERLADIRLTPNISTNESFQQSWETISVSSAFTDHSQSIIEDAPSILDSAQNTEPCTLKLDIYDKSYPSTKSTAFTLEEKFVSTLMPIQETTPPSTETVSTLKPGTGAIKKISTEKQKKKVSKSPCPKSPVPEIHTTLIFRSPHCRRGLQAPGLRELSPVRVNMPPSASTLSDETVQLDLHLELDRQMSERRNSPRDMSDTGAVSESPRTAVPEVHTDLMFISPRFRPGSATQTANAGDKTSDNACALPQWELKYSTTHMSEAEESPRKPGTSMPAPPTGSPPVDEDTINVSHSLADKQDERSSSESESTDSSEYTSATSFLGERPTLPVEKQKDGSVKRAVTKSSEILLPSSEPEQLCIINEGAIKQLKRAATIKKAGKPTKQKFERSISKGQIQKQTLAMQTKITRDLFINPLSPHKYQFAVYAGVGPKVENKNWAKDNEQPCCSKEFETHEHLEELKMLLNINPKKLKKPLTKPLLEVFPGGGPRIPYRKYPIDRQFPCSSKSLFVIFLTNKKESVLSPAAKTVIRKFVENFKVIYRKYPTDDEEPCSYKALDFEYVPARIPPVGKAALNQPEASQTGLDVLRILYRRKLAPVCYDYIPHIRVSPQSVYFRNLTNPKIDGYHSDTTNYKSQKLRRRGPKFNVDPTRFRTLVVGASKFLVDIVDKAPPPPAAESSSSDSDDSTTSNYKDASCKPFPDRDEFYLFRGHYKEFETIHFERNVKVLDAMHTLNHLFQYPDFFTEQDMDNICLELHDSWLFNRHRGFLFGGNYDIHVIRRALEQHHYQCIRLDRGINMKYVTMGHIFGFIVKIPIPPDTAVFDATIDAEQDGIGQARHWAAMRYVHGYYYHIDSRMEFPALLGREQEAIEYIMEVLLVNGNEIYAVVRDSYAQLNNWLFSYEERRISSGEPPLPTPTGPGDDESHLQDEARALPVDGQDNTCTNDLATLRDEALARLLSDEEYARSLQYDEDFARSLQYGETNDEEPEPEPFGIPSWLNIFKRR